MKRQKLDSVAVFVSEDLHRPWQLERVRQMPGVVLCDRMTAQVVVVVTTPAWLATKRSLECLFVLAQARLLAVVSFDWVVACETDAAALPPTKPFVLNDATLEAARRGAATLLAGHVVVASRQLPGEPGEGGATGELRGSRTGLKLSTPSYRDMCVLALLHGAEVYDSLSLPFPCHRGFTSDHVEEVRALAPEAVAGAQPVFHVLVPATDSVSKLGMAVYESLAPGFRPVLVEWLLLTLHNQTIANADRFEVY